MSQPTARDRVRTELIAFRLLEPDTPLTLDRVIQAFIDAGWTPPEATS